MIIEFYGLPGTGKTATAKKLEQETDFNIVKIKTKQELIFFNILFLLKHPIKFFVLLYFIIVNSVSLKEFYYKFMNAFLNCNAKYQKSKKYKKAIIDQGYFQGILSIFNKEIKNTSLNKYLNIILKPDILFIFEAPQVVRDKRILERGYYIRRGYNKEYLKNLENLISKNNNRWKNFSD
jgi:hypothetical protein